MIINGVYWSIKLVSPSNPILLTPWETYALGVCDKSTQTIYINKTLNFSAIKDVLYHEFVHAAIFSYQIDLSYEEEELIAKWVGMYGNEIFKNVNAVYSKIK